MLDKFYYKVIAVLSAVTAVFSLMISVEAYHQQYTYITVGSFFLAVTLVVIAIYYIRK